MTETAEGWILWKLGWIGQTRAPFFNHRLRDVVRHGLVSFLCLIFLRVDGILWTGKTEASLAKWSGAESSCEPDCNSKVAELELPRKGAAWVRDMR